jgi:hypothetical protein
MRSGTASLAHMTKVDPEIVQWHCRWARRIPEVYTVKPQHARLAVSPAVARSYVLAGASSVRRLATATNAMPAMMVAGFSYSASPAFAAVLRAPRLRRACTCPRRRLVLPHLCNASGVTISCGQQAKKRG